MTAVNHQQYDKAQLLDFYRQMRLIREFEREAERQYTRGNIKGFLHVYSGEEAIAVGAIATLQPQDYVVTHYRDHGQALAMGETEGMVKLVVDSRYGELLGGHLIGPEVTELLGELSLTRLLEGTTLELGWAVHAHPTISEMLKEAALDAEGRVLHM